jgi:hypothetical protein
MPLVIDNPTAEAQLHAFATSRGLRPDEAIIEALSEFDDDETEADEVRAAIESALDEDPADSVLLEDYIEQVKRERAERDLKAVAA